MSSFIYFTRKTIDRLCISIHFSSIVPVLLTWVHVRVIWGRLYELSYSLTAQQVLDLKYASCNFKSYVILENYLTVCGCYHLVHGFCKTTNQFVAAVIADFDISIMYLEKKGYISSGYVWISFNVWIRTNYNPENEQLTLL